MPYPLLSSLAGASPTQWALAWLLFAFCGLLAWRPWARAQPAGWLGAAVFSGAIVACIVAFRWPTLLVPHEINPDESQLISGAFMLRHDPVFWRSVDGDTMGPLDFYALIVPTMLAGDQPYFGARALGVLLSAAVVVLGFLSARALFSDRVARIGTMPLVAFFAFAHQVDFVQYASELVPITLLSLGIACLVRFMTRGGGAWLFAAGLMLAAVTLAKLQAAPIAATIFLCAVITIAMAPAADRKRALALLFGGALLVPLTLAIYALTLGVGAEIKRAYIDGNLSYTQAANRMAPAMRRALLWRVFEDPGRLSLLAGVGITLVLAIVARRGVPRAWRWYLGLGLAAGVAAFACAVISRYGAPKYFLLFAPALGVLAPCALAMAAADDSTVGRPLAIATWTLFLSLGIGLPAWERLQPLPGPHEHYSSYAQTKEPATVAVVAELRRWVKPGDFLAVWAAPPEFYVRAGCRQATRDGETSRMALDTPERDYFQARYLRDLEASRPRVFLDGTRVNRRGFELQTFPQLEAYVQTHYRLETEVAGRRIHVRRDIVAPLAP